MEVIKTAASPSVQPPASSSCSDLVPWVDLPEALTDLILDRLPLADYIRFEAVCTKWQSIKQDHRLLRRGSPLPFPWLYVYPRAKNLDPIISLNPFDPADPPKCRSLRGYIDDLWSSRFREERLVECNGDILMVVVLNLFPAEDFRMNIKGLLVFRADFSRKMWVRVESLGDRALFVSSTCSFSLVAANVGVTENYVIQAMLRPLCGLRLI